MSEGKRTAQTTATPEDYNRGLGYDKKLEWALAEKEKLKGYITDLTKLIDALDHLTREEAGLGVVRYSSAEKSREPCSEIR